MLAAPVAFIKKERKGNFRKKEKIDNDDDNDAEDVSKKIQETRLEHTVGLLLKK